MLRIVPFLICFLDELSERMNGISMSSLKPMVSHLGKDLNFHIRIININQIGGGGAFWKMRVWCNFTLNMGCPTALTHILTDLIFTIRLTQQIKGDILDNACFV